MHSANDTKLGQRDPCRTGLRAMSLWQCEVSKGTGTEAGETATLAEIRAKPAEFAAAIFYRVAACERMRTRFGEQCLLRTQVGAYPLRQSSLIEISGC